jgi:hypothetical protein
MAMRVTWDLAKLKITTPGEYLSRFLFGGLVTVLATLIANHFGPVVGGLFLAFPGILPPGLTLTEKHVEKKKASTGKSGTRFGRAEASIEAAGASAGSLGLMAFGLVIWKSLATHGLLASLLLAIIAWLIVAFVFWWLRKRL